MAVTGVITSQTGAKQFHGTNMTKYSMFVGGTNATHHALLNYSPAMNGFGRLFMVRTPLALTTYFSGGNPNKFYTSDNQFMQFKHMLEYMNRSVSGFGDKTLEPASTAIQGGFAGRSFNTPTVTKEQTTEFTVGLYELDGMPVMTVLDAWMNMIGDENSGLATYGGYISGGEDSTGKQIPLYKKNTDSDNMAIEFNEANHTCEFIYILHDRSGAQVQRAVMLADCYPKGVQQGNALNMEAGGTHDNITYEVTFNCVVYRSPIINAIANDLLKQYRIVSNSLNFNPELGDAVYGTAKGTFAQSMGTVPTDNAVGTEIGNFPVFDMTNHPTTITIKNEDANTAKYSGNATIKP